MPMPILNIAINSCNASLEHQKTPKEHTNKSNIKQLIKRTQFIKSFMTMTNYAYYFHNKYIYLFQINTKKKKRKK